MKKKSASQSAFFNPRVLIGLVLCSAGVLLALAGLSKSVTGMSAMTGTANPVPLINQPLVPDAVAPGGAGFTLTVNGTGFVPGSLVNWNGSPRFTTSVGSSQLTAGILASDIAIASTASVTVTNPSPGGGSSNVVFLPVSNASSSVSFSSSEAAAGTTAASVLTADFNGDGKLDLAATISNAVSILLGNGDGTFAPAVPYDTDESAIYLTAGDFNHDGNIDLAAAGLNSLTISILLGNGDGTFQAHVTYPGGALPLGITNGDFNGDGKLDLAVTEWFGGNTVAVLLGNGDGSFQPLTEYATGLVPNHVVTADFNQDGRLDLAVTNDYANTVSILLGRGDGTFRPHRDFGTGPNDSDIVAADFDGDGRIDLAVCNESGNSLSILLGNGDGTFQSHVDYATAANPRVMAQADLNADGILDLVTQNGASETISVLLGNGDGTFQAHIDSSDQNAELGIVAADFNDDGRLDIAGANGVGTVSIFLQHTLNGGDSCLPPPSGLVSWWSGDRTADDVQGINPGVLKNGASFARGMVGPAFRFDGVDDWVRIPNSSSLSQTRITLDAWLYPTGNAGLNRHIISKDNEFVSREYVLALNDDGRFHAFVVTGFGQFNLAGSTIPPLNTWYHVAMTHDGQTLRLYVNGILDAWMAASGDIIVTSNPVGIGANTQGSYFKGIIDEAQIFDRVLTDAEILAIYQAGADGQCKPEIFVASIAPSYEVLGHGFLVSTSIVIQDENGVGIEDASAQIKTILPSGSILNFPVTTDATGQATISFGTGDSGLYKFKVRRVTHPTREYDPSLNIETIDTLLIP